jgi:anti-sigma factor ChrR (cupin superfamily)
MNIDVVTELVIRSGETGPNGWVEKMPGLWVNLLWEDKDGKGSVSLVRFEKGAGIPKAHVHASRQSMYLLSGRYEYTETNLVLEPGDFYTNEVDHAHGPTYAHEESLMLEIHDGPRFYEKPDYLY